MAAIALLAAPLLSAQAVLPITLPTDEVAPLDPVDQEWELLKNLGRDRSQANGGQRDLVQDADQLREFYSKHPNHAQARNAKCLEALALVRAGIGGNQSLKARRERVVAEMRQDRAVDSELRAHLIALVDHLAVGRRADLSREGKLAAYEQIVRGLIAEFPELSNGYESLMYIARDSPASKAPGLAREVAGMTGAPEWVKAEAQRIADRFSLIGQSLPDLMAPIVGSRHPLADPSGRPVVIYSWASSSAVSITRAKVLAPNGPEGAIIVGVCLDQGDLSTARAGAAADALPGEQVYDERGRDGAVAKALVLSEPGLMYVTDAGGVVRSVTAQHEIGAALAVARP